MRKKLVGGLLALGLAIGGGVAIAMTSSDAHACTKCNTSNKARKCGRCQSERLFAKKSWWENGKLRTNWKCEDCNHGFTTETRNGKEVVLVGLLRVAVHMNWAMREALKGTTVTDTDSCAFFV